MMVEKEGSTGHRLTVAKRMPYPMLSQSKKTHSQGSVDGRERALDSEDTERYKVCTYTNLCPPLTHSYTPIHKHPSSCTHPHIHAPIHAMHIHPYTRTHVYTSLFFNNTALVLQVRQQLRRQQMLFHGVTWNTLLFLGLAIPSTQRCQD
jgi:hypothetical protein